MFSRSLTPRRLSRWLGLMAVVSAVVVAVSAAGAMARPTKPKRHHGFPIPTCSWVSTTLVSRALGVQVRALPPSWSTSIAPVLSCSYVERQARLQVTDQPIVRIEFRELQRFRVDSGYVAVRHLGLCVARASCPRPREPAWLRLDQAISAGNPYAMPFDARALLGVQDGLNAIVVHIQNPDGPLPTGGDALAAERLARVLLPRFVWR